VEQLGSLTSQQMLPGITTSSRLIDWLIDKSVYVLAGCGGTFHGNTGYIATPGNADGKDYPHNTECAYPSLLSPGSSQ
jgi:hypothetical protein